MNGAKLVELCAGADPVRTIQSKLPDAQEHEVYDLVTGLELIS